MNDEKPVDTHPTPDELHDAKVFFERHGQTLLVGLCVALVLVIGINLYKYRRARKADEAAQQLSVARTAGDLQSWMDQFGGDDAADVVAVRLAAAQFSNGKFQESLHSYEAFLAKNAEHTLGPVAELGRAHALEALGRTADALTAFETFSAARANHFLRPDAVLGRARCLEQLGQLEQARTVYEDFLAASPESDAARRADAMLKRLNREIDKQMQSPIIGGPGPLETRTAAPDVPVVDIPIVNSPTSDAGTNAAPAAGKEDAD